MTRPQRIARQFLSKMKSAQVLVLASALALAQAQVPTDSVGVVIGGFGGGASLEVADSTGTCQETDSSPTLPEVPAGQIEGWIAEYVDGYFFLCGGQDLNYHSECYYLSPGDSAWTQSSTTLNNGRDYPASLEFNGQMVILGGYNNGAGWLDTVERKGAGATGEWVVESSWELPRGTYDNCAGQVDATRIINVGGNIYGESANEDIRTVEILDTNTGTWAAKEDMPGPGRAGHGCLVTEINGDKGLIVAGGCTNSCQDKLGDVHFFSFSSETWTTLHNLSEVRYGAKMTHIDGKPAIVGGYHTSLMTSIEIYDPATDTWSMHSQDLTFGRWAFGMPKYVPQADVHC